MSLRKCMQGSQVFLLGAVFVTVATAAIGWYMHWSAFVPVALFVVLLAFIVGQGIQIRRYSESLETSNQDLRQSEKHMRAILDNTVDGIITINTQGVIKTYNAACQIIFGYDAAEAVGQNVSMLMPEPDRGRHDTYIEKYLQSGQAQIIGIGREVTGRRKDGSTFPMDLSIGEVNEGTRHTFVGIIRDITERKQAESELRKSHQAMDDFVYIVSHDLKEPLRGIYSYSQFLQEDSADRLDEDGQSKLETLKTLSRRMEELIDTLLHYSRLGRVDLAFRETDLNEVLQKTLDLMEPLINRPDVAVHVNGSLPTIVCDSAHVSEIFRNLITNGLKYNESDRKEIEIGVTESHEDYLGIPVFFVADNGIGIKEKHHEAVFKMFKRLHQRDAYGGGTGSGLTIVQKIVDRHNGRIWIESDGHSGTRFYFTLTESIGKAYE